MMFFSRICITAIGLIFSTTVLAQFNFSLHEASAGLPHLYGEKKNASYLYCTAGDRLYAIGDQAGCFPPVGFHVPGEMGGIWQQPIKLFDGFRLRVTDKNSGVSVALHAADSFLTYSFTSVFRYAIPEQKLTVNRTQFVPDGKPVLVVEYAFTNTGIQEKSLTIELSADANLMPVWLGERTGMIDSTDRVDGFDQGNHTLFFADDNNTWFAAVSTADAAAQYSGFEKTPYKGKGLTGKLTSELNIKGGETAILRYYFSGSMKSKKEIVSQMADVEENLQRLFKSKKERYAQLEKNAAITIPDSVIAEAYQWGKYSSDWLVRDVPDMGVAMSAGLPDYPWFFSNDQAAAFNALLGTIQPDIFFSSWKMLNELSDKVNNGTGSIIHEASANGAVYAKDRMEESQLHIITAWNIFKWTGNKSFLDEHYQNGKKIWAWLQEHDTNHNGYIEGYGGTEIEGLNEEMLDVQVHTYRFLTVMEQMAVIEGEPLAAASYRSKATRLKSRINQDWWVPEENRYADFISSKEKALQIIDSALVNRVHEGRNDWAGKKLRSLKAYIQKGEYKNQGYLLYYNGSGIMPIEEGMADTARALKAIKADEWFTNKYGSYITGIERPDDLSIDEGNFKHDSAFNYNRAVMPAATNGLIISACRYGRYDIALKYIHTMLNSFNYATPGTMYEVSPDYGMFVQAWNICGLNIPILQYFFGIDPMAWKKQVSIKPGFPETWNKAAIQDVIIGDNRLSMQYNQDAGSTTYRIQLNKPGWSVKLSIPAHKIIYLNGKKMLPQLNYVILTGTNNTVRWK